MSSTAAAPARPVVDCSSLAGWWLPNRVDTALGARPVRHRQALVIRVHEASAARGAAAATEQSGSATFEPVKRARSRQRPGTTCLAQAFCERLANLPETSAGRRCRVSRPISRVRCRLDCASGRRATGWAGMGLGARSGRRGGAGRSQVGSGGHGPKITSAPSPTIWPAAPPEVGWQLTDLSIDDGPGFAETLVWPLARPSVPGQDHDCGGERRGGARRQRAVCWGLAETWRTRPDKAWGSFRAAGGMSGRAGCNQRSSGQDRKGGKPVPAERRFRERRGRECLDQVRPVSRDGRRRSGRAMNRPVRRPGRQTAEEPRGVGAAKRALPSGLP